MLYLIRPIERHLRRHLTSERNRQRFDRAKRFVDETVRHGEGDEMAHRMNARWLKFLCSRPLVQRDIWPVAYLRHLGHDGLKVGLPNDKLEQMGLRTPVAKRFELARQMHAAKRLLSRGGIVFNVPDARQNLDNSRPVEFFGRQRRIAAGFAELALETGAHVVPIAYRFSPRGFFVLEFGAPFHVLRPQSSHDERVDSLVGQYANFLRDEWRRYPWNIGWEHLRYYCLLPEVDPGALGEKAEEAISGGAREGFAL